MVCPSPFRPAPLEVMSWHAPSGSRAVSLVKASRGTPDAERRGSGQQLEAALPILGTKTLHDKAGAPLPHLPNRLGTALRCEAQLRAVTESQMLPTVGSLDPPRLSPVTLPEPGRVRRELRQPAVMTAVTQHAGAGGTTGHVTSP
jgi:hypothetical protein